MKSSKLFSNSKRSHSPAGQLLKMTGGNGQQTVEASERKKKSSSAVNHHNHHNNNNNDLQYQHNNQLNYNNNKKKTPISTALLKQFDTHYQNLNNNNQNNKTTQKKKHNNYLKQLLRSNNNQQTNKYRIVTEPVEDRLLYLGNSNFGFTNNNINGSSSNGGLLRGTANNVRGSLQGGLASNSNQIIRIKNSSGLIKLGSNNNNNNNTNKQNIGKTTKLSAQQTNNNNNRQYQQHHQYTEKYLKLNIRTNGNINISNNNNNKTKPIQSKQKQRKDLQANNNNIRASSGDGFYYNNLNNKSSTHNNNNNLMTTKTKQTNNIFTQPSAPQLTSQHQYCPNCQKYSFNYLSFRYQKVINAYKKELNSICMDKILWKAGELSLDQVKQQYFKLKQKGLDYNYAQSIQNEEVSDYNRLLSTMVVDADNRSSSEISRHTEHIKQQAKKSSHALLANSIQKRHKTSANSVQKQERYRMEEYRNPSNNRDSTKKYRSPSSQSQHYKKNNNDKLSSQQLCLLTNNKNNNDDNFFTTNVNKLDLDRQLRQIKKHMIDLMSDVECLSAIDYPKMLALNVFKYDPFYVESPSAQQMELKQLLGQLRVSMEGKVRLDDDAAMANYQHNSHGADCISNNMQLSEHNRMIFRNLKNRLNHYLRQNLQLRMRKQVLQRSQQITKQSQDYLRTVIQDVLFSYVDTLSSQCGSNRMKRQ